MLALLLSAYFACLLMVAGCAKLDDPHLFESTLRVLRVLPRRMIRPASRIIPWLEMVFAVVLISGISPFITASVNLVLFASFLFTKLVLFIREPTSDCGCYGSASRRNIDPANITVSILFVVLAVALLWLETSPQPTSATPRIAASLLLLSFGFAMIRRVFQRHQLKFQSS